MAANFSDTNAAFSQLLQAANGRYDLVERALVQATHKNGGRAPRLQDVLSLVEQMAGSSKKAARSPKQEECAA